MWGFHWQKDKVVMMTRLAIVVYLILSALLSVDSFSEVNYEHFNSYVSIFSSPPFFYIFRVIFMVMTTVSCTVAKVTVLCCKPGLNKLWQNYTFYLT